jgi:hypothetical protein
MLAVQLHMCLLVSEQAGCKHRLQGSTCMYGHTVQSAIIRSHVSALTLARAPLSHACLARVDVEPRMPIFTACPGRDHCWLTVRCGHSGRRPLGRASTAAAARVCSIMRRTAAQAQAAYPWLLWKGNTSLDSQMPSQNDSAPTRWQCDDDRESHYFKFIIPDSINLACVASMNAAWRGE